MHDLTDAVDWLERNAALSSALVIGSVVFAVASLWVVHRFLTTIPPDYFQREHRPLERFDGSHPVLRWTLLAVKNALGALLVLFGVVMLFTPGQGVLSIVLGLTLLDIPGKRKLERKLLKREGVLRVVNHLRARRGQPPLEL